MCDCKFRATAAFVLASLCATAAAGNGDLDPGFGSGGVALSAINNLGPTLTSRPVVQSDGKILVCGYAANGGATANDFYVARFSANGQLDTGFNFSGRTSVDFAGGDDQCTGVAVQTDGKIVLAGFTTSTTGHADFAVARLNNDGSLDNTFGLGTGKTTIAFDLGGNNYDGALAVAVQDDGKIVACGYAQTASNGFDFAVARLASDGSRDATFNLTGKTTVGFDVAGSATKEDICESVAIDAQGRIVAAGYANAAGLNNDFAAIRLLSNGQLDGAFSGGRVRVGFDLGAGGGSNDDVAYALTLTRDGKIVLAGTTDISTTNTRSFDMALLRLNDDGAQDNSFGINGKVVVPIDAGGNSFDFAYGVAEQGNGKLVVAGNASIPPSGAMTLVAAARLNADGSPDTEFGSLGKKTFDFGLYSPSSQTAFGVAFQGTRIIVAGLATVGMNATDLFVARLQNDLIFADGFD